MSIGFQVVPSTRARDADLGPRLLDLWVEATNTGGAIGFAAPVSAAEVAPVLDVALARVALGHDDLGLLVDDDSGEVVGMASSWPTTRRPPRTGAWSRGWRCAPRCRGGVPDGG